MRLETCSCGWVSAAQTLEELVVGSTRDPANGTACSLRERWTCRMSPRRAAAHQHE